MYLPTPSHHDNNSNKTVQKINTNLLEGLKKSTASDES